MNVWLKNDFKYLCDTCVLGNDNYVNPKELDHIGIGRVMASVASCLVNNIQVIAFTKFIIEYMKQFFWRDGFYFNNHGCNHVIYYLIMEAFFPHCFQTSTHPQLMKLPKRIIKKTITLQMKDLLLMSKRSNEKKPMKVNAIPYANGCSMNKHFPK